MSKRKVTRAIVIHCSATRPDADVGADWVRAEHLRKGYADNGYALVIRRSGVVEVGRALDAVGAHVKGRNSDTVGICLIGGLDAQGRPAPTFEAAQLAALKLTVRFLKAIWPGAEVVGHRDLSPDLDGDGTVEPHEWLKQCPCFDVRKWWREGMPLQV